MKVIILNGSPKAEGNTATALHEVEHVLNEKGIETEWIHVGHRSIHACIACNQCWNTGVCAFGASVSIARRGGSTATMDVLNKYFLKTNMPVVPSQYWSIAHGTEPGEVAQDKEGMQTMRQLGLNMAFMIKYIRLGMETFGSPKIKEDLTETHYIR